jgi:hypothetical protein
VAEQPMQWGRGALRRRVLPALAWLLGRGETGMTLELLGSDDPHAETWTRIQPAHLHRVIRQLF